MVRHRLQHLLGSRKPRTYLNASCHNLACQYFALIIREVLWHLWPGTPRLRHAYQLDRFWNGRFRRTGGFAAQQCHFVQISFSDSCHTCTPELDSVSGHYAWPPRTILSYFLNYCLFKPRKQLKRLIKLQEVFLILTRLDCNYRLTKLGSGSS